MPPWRRVGGQPPTKVTYIQLGRSQTISSDAFAIMQAWPSWQRTKAELAVVAASAIEKRILVVRAAR